jgi:agmatinase
MTVVNQSMKKEDIIKQFNPNDLGKEDSGIFGLPFTPENADIVLIPVPWEATVSYGSGTAFGPDAIFEASLQMDLNHYDYPNLWKRGIAMDEFPEEILMLGAHVREKAEKVIRSLEKGKDPAKSKKMRENYEMVNDACEALNDWVEDRVKYWRKKKKIVGLVGGDHSTPLGYLRHLATEHKEFGVLVLDAHLDLRKAFEGFTYSHASIFRNAMELPQITKLVQAGIRDFCLEETEFVESQKGRISVHYDRHLQRESMSGKSWKKLFEGIIAELPEKVYVSIDIDGLDPKLCPNTGTPVPGGFQFEQACFLLDLLGKSGKKIIGFDLCEVSPGEDDWDGNVGARMLYQLCGLAAENA